MAKTHPRHYGSQPSARVLPMSSPARDYPSSHLNATPRTKNFRPNAELPKSVASAVRVKNFKRLVDAAGGEENLAVALEVTLHRLRELAEGVNFMDETTHHLETVLGLKSGFLDQVNPILAPEDERRLREGPAREPEMEAAEMPVAVLAAPPATASVPESFKAPAEARDLSTAAPGPTLSLSPPPAAGSSAAVEVPAASSQTMSKRASSMVKKKVYPAETAQPATQIAVQGAPAAPSTAVPEETLREIRRANLAVLTSRPGTKSQLAALTEMSPANISHRLHGNKHFDQDTADFFCSKLNLPAGWFDTPRKEADVPAHVHELLQAQSAAASQGAPRKARATKKAEGIPATLAMPAAALPGVAASVAAPTKALSLAEALPPVTTGGSSAAEPSARRAAPTAAAQPAASKAAAAASSVTLAKATPPAQAAVSASLTAPLLEGSPALGPIAEALVKTLALKARAGRISEETALRMLTEVSLL